MADDKTALFNFRQYREPGPVARRYIESEGPIDLIRGPWGSGKTVATVFKLVRHVAMLAPICKERYVDRNGVVHDGVIHAKGVGIRSTYRDMARTALKSWHNFWPKNGPFTKPPVADHYKGGIDRPVEHTLEWEVLRYWPDGPRRTPVVFGMEFGAIGDQSLDTFFKGFEITFGWVNECDQTDESVPARLYGRTGRYPPRAEIHEFEAERLGVERDEETGREVIKLPRIVMGDFNPPGEDNWTYKYEFEEPEKYAGTFKFFPQPSGLSAMAENRAGKTRADYEAEERAFGGPTTADSQRNVHGKYANKADGNAVYGTFDMFTHVADAPLAAVPGVPLLIGLDGGGRPAAVIGQVLDNGQLRMLREICARPDEVTGAARFGGMILAVLLRDFPGLPIAKVWGDPSDFEGNDKKAGDLAFMEAVGQAIGKAVRPTETNDIRSRVEALRYYVDLRITAQTPGLIVSRCMKTFIRGMSSQYHETKASSEGKTVGLEIVKNHFSHVCNAAEYLAYGYRGRTAVIKEAGRQGRAANVVPITSVSMPKDFNVFDV